MVPVTLTIFPFEVVIGIRVVVTHRQDPGNGFGPRKEAWSRTHWNTSSRTPGIGRMTRESDVNATGYAE